MELPVVLQDLMCTLLAKSAINSWNIHQNNYVINLNIKFSQYDESNKENLSYKKVSEKQLQRNIQRATEHKSKKENLEQSMTTRSQARKCQDDIDLSADKESSRHSASGDHCCENTDPGHTSVNLTPTGLAQDTELDVSLPVSEPQSMVPPERPEHEPELLVSVKDILTSDHEPPPLEPSPKNTEPDHSSDTFDTPSYPHGVCNQQSSTKPKVKRTLKDTTCIYTQTRSGFDHNCSYRMKYECIRCHVVVCNRCMNYHAENPITQSDKPCGFSWL